jgi:hypothetical protein
MNRYHPYNTDGKHIKELIMLHQQAHQLQPLPQEQLKEQDILQEMVTM